MNISYFNMHIQNFSPFTPSKGLILRFFSIIVKVLFRTGGDMKKTIRFDDEEILFGTNL